MDKEALKKNLFWYLLGGFGLVWLILWICAMASGSDEGEKNRKAQPEKQKSLAEWKSKTPKNAKFIKPWDDYRMICAGQKDTVWRRAWEAQASFYVWPRKPDGTDFNQEMLYAADSKNLPVRKREEYVRIYPDQFKDLDKLVAPAYFGGGDEKAAARRGYPGSGPTKGANGGDGQASAFDVIMGPTMAGSGGSQQGPGGRGGKLSPRGSIGGASGTSTSGEGVSFTTVLKPKEDFPPPTPEEIWIVQEDFWVKREMLHIVRAVQQSVGHFVKVVDVNKDEAKPVGVQPDAVVKRFSNGVWEFTLYIEQPKGASQPVISAKSTIKNISPSHAVQPLSAARGPLEFDLIQGPVHYQMFISGEPLPWNVPYPIGTLKGGGLRAPDNLRLDQDFDLEQKFDWSNAPVRRIDALRTAQQSHRTAKCLLVPNVIFKTADVPVTGVPNPTTTGATGTPTGPNLTSGGPNATVAASNSDPTPYLLERNRYIMSKPESRHLPIAMVLVVEPTHINDVLIAVANSKLHIQTTQVAFHQVAVARPPDPKPEPDKKAGMGFNGNPMMEKGQGNAIAEDVDNNLVELTVYGIATLYERPKKEEPKPANQPPQLTPPKPKLPAKP